MNCYLGLDLLCFLLLLLPNLLVGGGNEEGALEAVGAPLHPRNLRFALYIYKIGPRLRDD